MKLRYYIWKYAHNGWAHWFMAWPWEPKWVQRFHDWTAGKMLRASTAKPVRP